MTSFDQSTDPVWSPDGRHIAILIGFKKWQASLYRSGGGWSNDILIDDALLEPRQMWVSEPVFSPDISHVAAVGSIEKAVTVFVDGEQHWRETFPICKTPVWSPDGAHLAAEIGFSYKEMTVAVDGKAWNGRYDGVKGVTWSPDGKRVAATVTHSKRFKTAEVVETTATVVIDGVAWSSDWQACGSPYFGPDGQKVAARVKGFGGWTMAIDGKSLHNIFSRYDDITDPTWSPDGSKIMFVARKRGKYYRVVKEVAK